VTFERRSKARSETVRCFLGLGRLSTDLGVVVRSERRSLGQECYRKRVLGGLGRMRGHSGIMNALGLVFSRIWFLLFGACIWSNLSLDTMFLGGEEAIGGREGSSTNRRLMARNEG